MATIQFDLVSPERKLASIAASQIEVPGADGDFTAMADHASMISTLRPGVLKVTAGSDVSEYIVTGGFVEISGEAASVLAEYALPKSEVTSEIVDDLIVAAQAAATGKTGNDKDMADKLVADTKALLDLI